MPMESNGKCANGRDKRLDTLPADKGASHLVEGAADHHRDPSATGVDVILNGEQTGFQIQRVDRRLGQEDIDASIDERFDLRPIAVSHFLKRDIPMGCDHRLAC